jgi:hypothetical protein
MPHSHSPVDDVEYWIDRVRFYLTCLQGRRALGHGDLAIGERIPDLLRAAGFADVRAWLADKVALLTPPYDEDENRAALDVIRDHYEHETYPFPREIGRRYFLAGGGAPEDFDAAWQRRRADQAQLLELVAEGVVSGTAGRLMYVVAATAP